MKKGIEKSFDFHSEMAKQLLTISLGGVAVLATLGRLKPEIFSNMCVLNLAILFLIISLASGILHLGALSKHVESETSVQDSSACLNTARLQQIFFIISVISLVVSLS